MPVIKHALHIPIVLAPAQRTSLRRVSPPPTPRQERICAELGITPEQFLHTRANGELFAGTGARRNF